MKRLTTFVIFSILLMGFSSEAISLSDRGVFQIILIMFAGGFLTAFTPCVYPLIPVTIGIIAEVNKNYKSSAFLMSVIYASGIIVTYTALGIIAGLGAFTFGNYMGNPISVSIIALIFFILGLSMLGFYEINLPESITRRILNIRGSNLVSLFAMGLVSGFVAAPCTGPILASALLYISTGGSPILGGLYLFSYASGLSIIFIIAGSFSSVLNKLPRSGRWMIVTRSIFGISIITYSFYLIDTLLNFTDKISTVVAVILLIAGIAGGGLTMEADFKPLKIKLLKLLMAVIISIGILTMLSGEKVEADNIKWVKDYDEGMRVATQNRMPVIIDFYANWCAACKEIKKKTLTDRDIQKESERFVMIMIDATNPDDRITELEKRYNVQGLPAIIFLNSQQKEIESLRVTGFIDSKEFLKRMKEVK